MNHQPQVQISGALPDNGDVEVYDTINDIEEVESGFHKPTPTRVVIDGYEVPQNSLGVHAAGSTPVQRSDYQGLARHSLAEHINPQPLYTELY